jgi:hypothetical protein
MSGRRNFLVGSSTIPIAAMLSGTSDSAQAADRISLDGKTIAGGVSADAAPPKVRRTDYIPQSVGAKSHFGLLDGRNPTTLKKAKQLLSTQLSKLVDRKEDPVLDWLDTFSRSFDEASADMVIEAASTVIDGTSPSKLVYEPQMFEAWLRSSSELLDRCLTYRRDMGAFEVDGVRTGIDYLAFLRVTPIQRSLIDVGNQADVAEIQRLAQFNASNKYGQAPGIDKVAAGHELESQGHSRVAEQTKAKETLKTELQVLQFDASNEAQLAKFTAYLTPGSAANCAERYLRLAALLADDIGDAYRKLYSASIGIRQVLKVSSIPGATVNSIPAEIPLFSGATGSRAAIEEWVKKIVKNGSNSRAPDVLDALVLWNRAVLRELERRTQREREVTIPIALNQPAGAAGAVILNDSDIQMALAGATGKAFVRIPIKLTQACLPFTASLETVRVVGVGLALVHDIENLIPIEHHASYQTVSGEKDYPANHQAQHSAMARAVAEPKFARTNATLLPPAQILPSGATYSRGPVLLTNVRIHGGAGGDLEPSIALDVSCRNIDPFGDWLIDLDQNYLVWYANTQSRGQLAQWLKGLILYLRVRIVTK